jgi:type II secretory pathway component PulF
MATRSESLQTSQSMVKLLLSELFKQRSGSEKLTMSQRELSTMLGMLSTLLDNGMPIQKAIAALASDGSLRKHHPLLRRLNTRLVEGSSLHAALSAFPSTFPAGVIQQVKLGESSGGLSSALTRINRQIDGWLTVRNNLIQKLSYPMLVIVAGSGLVAFMLAVVVPQFEKIYAESNVDLPWVTSVVTAFSRSLGHNAWMGLIPLAMLITLWIRIRTNVASRRKFHWMLTRLPLIGAFAREIAVLQFLRGVHAMSEAGFVPIDAIAQACPTVSNLHVRHELERLSNQLVHGSKLSAAMNSIEHLIPSSVRQLIMVGEHSGNITRSCEGASTFLENRLQRRLNTVMGMVEPLLTVGLATCIGWIVLAIYMPMFKMFDVMDY